MRNRSFRTRKIHRLRGLLLLALVLVAGSLVSLFAWRHAQEREQAPRPVPAQAAPTGNLVLKGEGFDYQVTRDQRPLFRIRGQKILSDRDQNMVLRGVRLTFFRANGSPLELTSRQGTYQVGSKEATLEGNVSVKAQDGVTLRTDKAILANEGTRLNSVGPVAFGIAPDLEGRADHLRADLKRGIYDLLGNITVHSRPGAEHLISMTADRIRANRTLDLLRATGNVRFQRDDLSFESPVASLFFSASGHHLQFVRGRWGVHLELQQAAEDGNDRVVEGDGWNFSLALDDQGSPERLALESQEGGDKDVTLVARDRSGEADRLTSPYINAGFTKGSLSAIHTAPPSTLREGFTFAPDFVVRLICSDTIDATFDPSGNLNKIDLFGAVDFHQGQMQGRGNQGTYEAATGRLQLQGAPAQILSGDGELNAPRIVSTSTTMSATGGVEVSSREGAEQFLPRGPMSESAGPAHIVAESAHWSSSPPAYAFDGKVRTWRGQDLLLADRLHGNPKQQTLEATGSVKSVWQPASAATKTAGTATTAIESLPVEVTADALSYNRGKRLLIYTGTPEARQGGRTLACGRIQARETAKGEIDRVECTDGVAIDDPVSHRKVKGEDAIYLPQSSEATVTGSPVHLTDAQGTDIKGRKLIYNLATGAIEMKADSGNGNQKPEAVPTKEKSPNGER